MMEGRGHSGEKIRENQQNGQPLLVRCWEGIHFVSLQNGGSPAESEGVRETQTDFGIANTPAILVWIGNSNWARPSMK